MTLSDYLCKNYVISGGKCQCFPQGMNINKRDGDLQLWRLLTVGYRSTTAVALTTENDARNGEFRFASAPAADGSRRIWENAEATVRRDTLLRALPNGESF